MKASFDRPLACESVSFRVGRLLSCALVLGAVSCTGKIGDTGNPGANTTTGGVTTGGVTGGATTGGVTTGGTTTGGGPADVGRVEIHRLNNTEYDNTMRDLLKVPSTMSKTFIADEEAFGFDNIASAFGMTDAQFEQYYNSADALTEQVFADATLRAGILTCTPTSASDTACMQQVLSAFGARAWRRPLTTDEVTRVVKLATDAIALGEDATGGIKQAVKGMLANAKFLYRIEFDDDPTSTVAHPISGYEMASRLSYLGWSSMPDDKLFAAAQSGELLTNAGLLAQLDRLLADGKGSFFVSGFAGQWLGLRGLESHQVEPTVFPGWTETLRTAMVQEGLSFFNEFLAGPRPMTDFFTADVNFVDPTLSKLYGIPITGTTQQRVINTTDQRLGFMGLASFLTFSSYAYRTAPTLRGKWILENLLCEEIPAPPPNVPKLDDGNGANPATQSQNVRIRLEAHRANPMCAACHATLDPIGMGLENFDAIGQYRTAYANGDKVDPSGVLPEGDKFSSLTELAGILGKDTRLVNCASTKMMTYALSRGLGDTDQAYLQQIRQTWAAKGMGLRALLEQIVLNDTFRFRHGEM